MINSINSIMAGKGSRSTSSSSTKALRKQQQQEREQQRIRKRSEQWQQRNEDRNKPTCAVGGTSKKCQQQAWLEKQRKRQHLHFLRQKMVAMNVVSPGGGGLPHPKHEPKLGSFIYLLALMAVIGGFLFGYDTGIVSSAMLFVPKDRDMIPMTDMWKEVIVSITPGMAGIGALFAGKASDIYGRRKMIILSTIVFTVGAIICSIGISIWILLIGRILLGIAIGFASMIVPIYVGESSPAHIRGKLITGFQLMICFGLVAANIFAAGFSYIYPESIGWRLMFGFAAIPSILQFVGFLFLPESPRWLYQNESKGECEEVLCKIYNGDKQWIAYELEEIHIAHEQQKQDDTIYGDGNVIYRILTNPSVRKALIIGSALQAFQQLSGINTIMYYTASIIRSAGVKNEHTTIWISVGTASVNFFATFIPMYFVERLGRRFLLLVSIIGVLIATLLMGGAFYLVNIDSAPTIRNSTFFPDGTRINTSDTDMMECLSLTNCDYCTTVEKCGFCGALNDNNQQEPGFCLVKNHYFAYYRSLQGPCASNSSSDIHKVESTNITYEWADNMCKTNYAYLPILLMVFFLCAFAAGYAPLPWVLNAEFYPLWARGTCVSFTTFCNWAFNLLVSLTFLSLSQEVTKFGTFFIYAGVTAIAFVIFYFVVPETKGLNLDEVQLLFMSKRERQRAVSTLKLKNRLSAADVSSMTK